MIMSLRNHVMYIIVTADNITTLSGIDIEMVKRSPHVCSTILY